MSSMENFFEWMSQPIPKEDVIISLRMVLE